MGMNLSQHFGSKEDEGDYEVQTGLRPGFIWGVYLDFAANENLALCFEALYAMKGSHEHIRISRMELDGVIEELERPARMDVKYNLDYLEIPVLLKLKVLSIRNADLFTVAGTAMGLKIRGYHELEGKVYFPEGNGEFSEITIQEKSKLRDVNMFDFSFVYGGAVALNTEFPLSIEYRFTLGWDYLHLPTSQYSESVALRNQSWAVLLCTGF